MPLRLLGYAAAALWGAATELPRRQEAARQSAIRSLRSPGHHLSRAMRNTKRRPKEMAYAMDVSTSTVFRLLRDEQPITQTMATRIVTALGFGTVEQWVQYQRDWDNRHTLKR